MYSTRVLIERSSLRQNVPPPSAVILWSQTSTDLVIANSQLHQMITGQATVRTHGTKIVVMDSYITNPTHHVLRAHADGATPSPYVYWGRNLTQGGRLLSGDGGAAATTAVQNIWVDGNEFHFNATGNFVDGTNVHVTNNVTYDGASGTPWESVVGNYITRTLSGNTGFAYQPAAAWNGTGTYQ